MRPMTRLLLVAGMAVTMFGFSPTPDTPVPPSHESQPVPSVSTPYRLPSVAPRVVKQWDAIRYKDKPCDLLTDEQARGVGFVEPGWVDTPRDGFPQCWRMRGHSSLFVKFYDMDLVGKVYRRETIWPGGEGAVPVTVLGQPALKVVFPGGDRCAIAVALAENQGFEVNFKEEGAEASVDATSVAETIMHNLGA
jgi:hypothetical protein